MIIACPSGDLHSRGAVLGVASNNFVEFSALVVACLSLDDLKAQHAVLVGDSELVINALLGACAIHHPKLLRFLRTTRCWLASVGSWAAHHVPHAFNLDAGYVANGAALSCRSSITLRPPPSWAVPVADPWYAMVPRPRCRGAIPATSPFTPRCPLGHFRLSLPLRVRRPAPRRGALPRG